MFYWLGLHEIKNGLFSVNIERQLANVSPFAMFITVATGIATVGTIAQTGIFDEIVSLIDDLISEWKLNLFSILWDILN